MGKTILVVDDEPTIREVVRRYLERDGYQVMEAEDGPTALNILETTPPNLLILDLMLPGMDGFQIIEKLRAQSNDTPILILTARDQIDDRAIHQFLADLADIVVDRHNKISSRFLQFLGLGGSRIDGGREFQVTGA